MLKEKCDFISKKMAVAIAGKEKCPNFALAIGNKSSAQGTESKTY